MLIFEAACPIFYDVVFTLSQHEKPCAIKKASSFNAFKRRLCLHGCSILYNQMLLSEKLYPHLLEIDETAQSRLEQMMPQLAKEAGATEELKASDPMKWVGLMNNCKAQAEEILMAELINS